VQDALGTSCGRVSECWHEGCALDPTQPCTLPEACIDQHCCQGCCHRHAHVRMQSPFQGLLRLDPGPMADRGVAEAAADDEQGCNPALMTRLRVRRCNIMSRSSHSVLWDLSASVPAAICEQRPMSLVHVGRDLFSSTLRGFPMIAQGGGSHPVGPAQGAGSGTALNAALPWPPRMHQHLLTRGPHGSLASVSSAEWAQDRLRDFQRHQPLSPNRACLGCRCAGRGRWLRRHWRPWAAAGAL
jgi:hypothetical protein